MVSDVVPTDLLAQRGAGNGVIGGQRHKPVVRWGCLRNGIKTYRAE